VKYQGGVGAACNSTLAPLTQSTHRVNSRGEWLSPPTEGTKIMPTGQTPASDCASCPAPENSETCVSYRPRENVCAQSGQPFTFTDPDNPLVAPQPAGGERETTFTSRWRVWMDTRYAGPAIYLNFTVRRP
jgi:hypothetical protein